MGVPRNLFPRLGVGEFCTWGRLEPAFGGYRHSWFPAGQSSRRGWRIGAGPFLIRCIPRARMDRHARIVTL